MKSAFPLIMAIVLAAKASMNMSWLTAPSSPTSRTPSGTERPLLDLFYILNPVSLTEFLNLLDYPSVHATLS